MHRGDYHVMSLIIITHMEPLPSQPSTDQKYKEVSSLNGNISRLTFTTEGLPVIIGKKLAGIVEELNSQVVNVESLKAYLAVGIPDEATLIRQYCWKIVFGYLPPERNLWAATVQKETKTYEGLVRMFLPEEKFPDYPLLLKKGHPRYAQLEEDFLLWEQIQKDTSRTHAEFSFFAAQSKQIVIPYLTSARREKFKVIYGENEEEYKQFLLGKEKQRKTYRYDYMTRILYIYSKLNPKVQYVQGMNQILAPIFYLVNITKPAHQVEEAACFFMFNNAICDILQLHIKDLDKSRNGIYGKLNEVNEILLVIDPQVWRRMDSLKIDPFFYCFRWVTLLYAQDFALFDTMRIWESIFSAKERCLYINLFAIAIILSIKEVILENQFTAILEVLHNISDLNIHQIIQITDSLYQQHKHTDFPSEAAKAKRKIEKQTKKEKLQQAQKEENEKQQRSKEKRKEEKKKVKGQKNKDKQKKKRANSQLLQVKSQISEQGIQQKVVKPSKKVEESTNQVEPPQQKSAKKGGIFSRLSNFIDKIKN